MNQKGSAGVVAAIIFIVIVTIILVIPKGKTISETPPYDPLAQLLPSPSATNTSYHSINSIEDALKYPDEADRLRFCNQKINSVSPKVGELIKTKFLDFSENNLTTLPPEIEKLNYTLRELVLVENNFSVQEQAKIKKLLPYTKIAFFPQKTFDPYFKDNWESYESKKFGFSFRYHPDLLVRKIDNGVIIENTLASMQENAYFSCAVEKAFIKMSITVEDNPENLSAIDYLKRDWEINPILKGDEYVVESEMERNQKMLKEIKIYKNGDIEGVIADAGESEHPSIISSHNNKLYYFHYAQGGETGSRIADVAKEILNQTLATFKYTN